MSIPCQQLMRTAERAPISEEEYAEINTWFSDQTHRYRPHSADPAKGGNFDYARYQADPSAYWSLYFRYLKRYPAIYLEAFLDNCMGLWYPDDMTIPIRSTARTGIMSTSRAATSCPKFWAISTQRAIFRG